MRTARSLTVSCSICCSMHAPCHACPPAMHAPLPRMPPCHACPPAMHVSLATHTPCHACSTAMYAPLPHTHPPPCHAWSPCGQNSWHTLLKILPCPNFVAGGNKVPSQALHCMLNIKYHNSSNTETQCLSFNLHDSNWGIVKIQNIDHQLVPIRTNAKN